MSEFREYIEHGWVLVPVQPGQKGPRTRGWNQRKNCITDPTHHFHSAGLAHAYSGTCAIDVDDYVFAAGWLAERGIDLDALFAAPDSVHIVSGRGGHGKLLYALPEPLASRTVAKNAEGKAALDFRCATAAGLTVQDVLPPSIHPDTGRPYKWQYGDSMVGDWRELPPIPEALHDLWLSELEAQTSREALPERRADLTELKKLLQFHDPDVNRNEWIKIGMAIHHETEGSQEGFDLWDEWSRRGKKYRNTQDLEAPWRSFHDTPNAVTVGFLRQGTVANADEFPTIDENDLDENDPWVKAEAERVARFQLVQVGQIARRDPPEWMVDGLVPQTDLAMMYGNPGAGKSFIALDLAFAVSQGITFFNRVTQAGPVVWIAAEAAGAMRNRAKAYAQARGVQLDVADLWVIEQTLSLMSQEDATALTQAVKPAKPKLIIIDTLAAASGGANENSGEDMNVVLSHCRKLHEATGALVLLVHHSGKDAARGARGWSGLRAAVNTEFMVQHEPSSPIRKLIVTKQRDAEDGVQLPFKLQSVPLGFDNETSCVIDPLDETMLSSADKSKLGGNQKLVFTVCYDLASVADDKGVAIQDVYDDATLQLPKPPKGQRDRRGEIVKRALSALHERGYITIRGDFLDIGAPVYEDDE